MAVGDAEVFDNGNLLGERLWPLQFAGGCGLLGG